MAKANPRLWPCLQALPTVFKFMISLRHLHKSFNQHPVLKDISLNITQGEIFGIIGGSGAGKSTLLRCINLLERPNSGEVWVNGQDLMQLRPKALRLARQKIGMIFQNYQLLNQQTVFDNIALPMKIQGQDSRTIEKKCHELLDIVGLSEKKLAYPELLSGGQKQRVAIARALTTQPSILLCDEATAALDPQNTNAILNLLLDIQRQYQITLVMITHDMQVAKKICQRLALMKQGEIVELSEWPSLLRQKASLIRETLYGNLKQQLPEFIINQLSEEQNKHSILRVLFPGQGATIPFISEMCRSLNMEINILSAQIDHHQSNQCGVMLVSMDGQKPQQIEDFLKKCQHHQIIGEVLGYVEHIHN
jgi:D-methionine transport system ATP-binding protein